jgi:hypothetical protein
LIDADGYYDHLILLVLNTFVFNTGFSMQPKIMLETWSRNSSMLLSKNILEYFRMIFRSEYSFQDWYLPLLLNYSGDKERQVSALAFDVLEESCQDQDSLNTLMKFNPSGQEDISTDLLSRGDMFVAKFLRSNKGFEILLQKGWI